MQNQPAVAPQHTLCFSHECSPAATDTFSGIRPADVPGFIVAQLFGAAAATAVFSWSSRACRLLRLTPSYRTPSRTRNIRPNERLGGVSGKMSVRHGSNSSIVHRTNRRRKE
jgi:hypothetical protein